MNIRAARWAVVLVASLALAAAADADYEEEYDEAPAAPAVPAKPLRPSPLLRQARGPAIGRPAPKPAVTPKPTTEAAPPPEYEDEELEEDVGGEEQQTTTTEAPKKGGVKTGVVRPFRSNADLIETLKRRRQQQQTGGLQHSSGTTTTTTTTPSSSEKGFKNGRRGSIGNKISGAADQTGSTSERKSTVNGRRFSGRSNKVTTSAEPPAEAEVEEQPTRSKVFGRSRRF